MPELDVASTVTLGAPAVLSEQVAPEEQSCLKAGHMGKWFMKIFQSFYFKN